MLKNRQDVDLDPSINYECSAALFLSHHLQHMKYLGGVALGFWLLDPAFRGTTLRSFVRLVFVCVDLARLKLRRDCSLTLVGALFNSWSAWRKRTLCFRSIK